MMRRFNNPLRVLAVLLIAGLAAACDDDEVRPPDTVDYGIFAEDGLGTIHNDASEEQRVTFEAGEAVAKRRFSPEEGLGPRFNVAFCAACHERPAFGGSSPRYRDFFLFGQRLSDGTFIAGDFGGVSHSYGIRSAPMRPARPENANIAARRNAIPFFGVGAIARINESAIRANEDPDDRDGDGISGRPNFDGGFVGRFGRKAQTVSIEGFIRGPLFNHLGITTNPLTPELQAALPIPSVAEERSGTSRGQGLRSRQLAQVAAPSDPLFDDDGVPDPEMSPQQLFDLVSWAMLLGAPRPATSTEETERGRLQFEELGCAGCHVPELQAPTGLVPLYSDLLLHDMGEEMADGIEQGVATGSEFRTQPLWGLAATGPYLHDGRADTIDGAIRWHGGEAQASRDAYLDLDETARADVLVFLESLGGADEITEGLLPPDDPIPAAGELGGPVRELAPDDAELFERGRRLYDRDLRADEGLGPFFNGDSCRACHFDPVIGGAGPIDVNVMRHGTWTDDGGFVAPNYGTILSKLSAPGLPRREPAPAHNVFEFRQTPSTMGLGLIESISSDEIIALADPDDEDGDGIRGIARVLPDGRLGRFGWKAGVPSIREFIRDALSEEVGATLPDETGFTFGRNEDGDEASDPEVSSSDIDAIEFFLQQLAPPAPRDEVPEGRAVFDEIGCADCHVPEMPGTNGPVPLYSDLLLHAVGPTDQPGIPDGLASELHFRTPPLWGLSHTAPYMHDGMASTIEAAIERHENEAQRSRDLYEGLSESDKTALLEFLGSL